MNLISVDLSISQPMITTTGNLKIDTNGNYTYSVTMNVTVMTESFVKIVGESLFLNGSLISSTSGMINSFYKVQVLSVYHISERFQ